MAPPPARRLQDGAGAVGILVGVGSALSLALFGWLLAGAPQPWAQPRPSATPPEVVNAFELDDAAAAREARAQQDRELAEQIARLEAEQRAADAELQQGTERQEERQRLEREQARIDAQMKQTRAAMERRERERKQRGLEGARSRVKITMYSTSWCPACKAARTYMDAQGIAYTDHDVDEDPAAQQAKNFLIPKGSVPTIDVGGVVMVGFSARKLERLIDAAARREVGLPQSDG